MYIASWGGSEVLRPIEMIRSMIVKFPLGSIGIHRDHFKFLLVLREH